MRNVKEEDGHITMVQLNRFSMPVDILKKYGVFKGHMFEYKKAKEAFDSIPEEKRKIPFICASRVVVMFPSDASRTEILRSLEFLLSDLKERWKEPTKEA